MPIPKQDLGWVAAGAILPALEIQYLDFGGDPLDLTGFEEAVFRIEVFPPSENELGAGTCEITDMENGVVTYDWAEEDMLSPGSYTAQCWVTNDIKKYPSDVYTYVVYDGPGEAP